MVNGPRHPGQRPCKHILSLKFMWALCVNVQCIMCIALSMFCACLRISLESPTPDMMSQCPYTMQLPAMPMVHFSNYSPTQMVACVLKVR